jgi:membrane-associated phospholipid phosphatase
MHGFLVTLSYYIHEFFTTITLGIMGSIVIAHLYSKNEQREIGAFLGGLIATSGAVYVLKNIFQVPRPIDAYILETGYAMPSGHASLSFFLATFLIYYIVRQPDNKIPETTSWLILGATAIIITASRVVLHVHTISQVLCGALLGTLVAYVAILYTRHKKS